MCTNDQFGVGVVEAPVYLESSKPGLAGHCQCYRGGPWTLDYNDNVRLALMKAIFRWIRPAENNDSKWNCFSSGIILYSNQCWMYQETDFYWIFIIFESGSSKVRNIVRLTLMSVKSLLRIKINVSTSRNIRLLRLIGVEDADETCFCPMDTNPEIKIKLQARVFIHISRCTMPIDYAYRL